MMLKILLGNLLAGYSLSKSENMCEADSTWIVQFKRAVLVVDGKREDLLKVKKVHIDDIRPMKFSLK